MSNNDVQMKNIITNGMPSEETVNSIRDEGFEYIAVAPAELYHPGASGSEVISFFAKPMNKEVYERIQQDRRDEEKTHEESQSYISGNIQ